MTVGVDVTSVKRIRALLSRFPNAEARFFTEAEQRYCNGHADPITHFAGTFAAKEAVVKATRLGAVAAWARRIEIIRDQSGVPRASIPGMADKEVTLSISHDGDVAVAIAVCGPRIDAVAERTEAAPPVAQQFETTPGRISELVTNTCLQRFLRGESGERRPGLHLQLTPLAECAPGSDFP